MGRGVMVRRWGECLQRVCQLYAEVENFNIGLESPPSIRIKDQTNASRGLLWLL